MNTLKPSPQIISFTEVNDLKFKVEDMEEGPVKEFLGRTLHEILSGLTSLNRRYAEVLWEAERVNSKLDAIKTLISTERSE